MIDSAHISGVKKCTERRTRSWSVHPMLCEDGNIPNLLAEEKMALLCYREKEATHAVLGVHISTHIMRVGMYGHHM